MSNKGATAKVIYKALVIMLVFFLYAFSPFYPQVNPGGSGLFIPTNNVAWILLISLALLSVGRSLLSGHIWWSNRASLFLAFIVVVVSCGFFVGVLDRVSWVVRVGSLCGAFVLFFSLIQLRQNILQNNIFFSVLVLAALLYSVAYLSSGAVTWLNLGNVFFQNNMLASALVTGVLAAVFLKDVTPIESSGRVKNFFLCGSIFICSVVVISLGSRIGALSLFFGLSCMSIYFLFGEGCLKKFSTSILLVVSAVMLSVVFGAGWSKTDEKINRMADGSDVRYYLYGDALRLIAQGGASGSGFGSYEKNMSEMLANDNKERMASGRAVISFGEGALTHPHNEVLYWLSEAGFFGLIIVCFFLFFVFMCLFSTGGKSGLLYLGVTSPLLLHSLVELPFYLSAWHWLVFVSILAFSLKINSFRFISLTPSFSFVGSLVVMPFFLGVIVFHVSTLRSLSSMSAYALNSSSSPEILLGASRNYYLSEFTELMVVRHMFHEDISIGSRSFFPAFIQVAESYLARHSNPIVYEDLALAYFLSGRPADSKRLHDKALNIYPESPGLLKMKSIYE